MSGLSNSRRGEIAQVVGSLLALLAVTAVIARMLVAAWDDHGLVFHVVRGAAAALGWGIDGVVVFAALFVLTLMVLFALDENKHLQGGLLLAATALVFVPSLVLMGRWYETVDFLAHPVPGAVGFAVALALGAVGSNVSALHGGRTMFPNAARALYTTAVSVVLVGFFERHLTYESPIVTVSGASADPATAGPLTLFVELLAVFGFVYLLGYFVRYSDLTEVVISSPDDDTVASFLGSLYGVADDRYGATTLEGGDVLNAARSRQHQLPQITGRLAFQFRPDTGRFSRRREVSYDNIRPVSRADVAPMEELGRERASLGSRVLQGFKRQLLLAAPAPVRNALRETGGQHLDRLKRADVILLLAPIDDILLDHRVDEEATEFDEEWVRTHEDDENHYLSVYNGISKACGRSTMPDVYVVATDADRVLEYGGGSLTSSSFTKFLRQDVLQLGHTNNVLPVSSEADEKKSQEAVIDRL